MKTPRPGAGSTVQALRFLDREITRQTEILSRAEGILSDLPPMHLPKLEAARSYLHTLQEERDSWFSYLLYLRRSLPAECQEVTP